MITPNPSPASLTRRDLEEINSIYESVEARSLGVERDLAHSGNVVEKELDLPRCIEIKERFGSRRLHSANLANTIRGVQTD